MKVRSVAAVFAAGLAAAALSTAPADAAGGGATVTKGNSTQLCYQPFYGGGTITQDYKQVTTPSGNTSITCHFHDINYTTSNALHRSGFRCNTFAGTTTYSRFTLTPSGEGTLVCKIKR